MAGSGSSESASQSGQCSQHPLHRSSIRYPQKAQIMRARRCSPTRRNLPFFPAKNDIARSIGKLGAINSLQILRGKGPNLQATKTLRLHDDRPPVGNKIAGLLRRQPDPDRCTQHPKPDQNERHPKQRKKCHRRRKIRHLEPTRPRNPKNRKCRPRNPKQNNGQRMQHLATRPRSTRPRNRFTRLQFVQNETLQFKMRRGHGSIRQRTLLLLKTHPQRQPGISCTFARNTNAPHHP